jgi:hypothetical protein
MALLIILWALGHLSSPFIAPQYCTQAPELSCTHWGHMAGYIDDRTKPIKAIRGKIQSEWENQPIDDVLVEIYKFEDEDPSQPGWQMQIDCHHRLAACITSEKGLFAFELPSGIYEVRASKRGWNTVSVIRAVDVRKGKNGDTDIELSIAK